jgi:hypothetical protein
MAEPGTVLVLLHSRNPWGLGQMQVRSHHLVSYTSRVYNTRQVCSLEHNVLTY